MIQGLSETELRERLGSDRKNQVIGAIVQLAKVSRDPVTLEKLKALVEAKDREVSFFAAQAVARISTRLGAPSRPVTSTGEPAEKPPTGEKLEPESLDRARLLAPSRAEIPLMQEVIRRNPDAIPEELRPPVASFLMKHGEKGDAGFIRTWLKACRSTLALVFVDSLEALSPADLEAALPDLLASEEPLVRGRAVSALQKIDPEEAEAHLSELLASRKSEERMEGISIAFRFPFPKVRDYVFTLLEEEQEPQVLKGCEILLASNPEVESALRLLDLMDGATPGNSKALNAMYRAVCGALSDAQILDPKQADPTAILERWRKERLKKFLANLEIQIAVATGKRREGMVDWLAKNVTTPEVREFIQKLSLNPSTEDVFQSLAVFFPEEKPKETQAPTPKDLPDPEKIGKLRGIEPDGFGPLAAWVREEAQYGAPGVRAAALNALFRCGPTRDDLTLAEGGLNFPDPAVQAVAVRLMEKIDRSRLQDFLPKLLGSQDPLLRARAIKWAIKNDQKRALEEIDRLARSSEAASRAQGVSCLMLLPIEIACGRLVSLLEIEEEAAIARQILVALLSNPGPKILAHLDRLQGNTKPAIRLLIAQARMDLFDILLRLGMLEEPPPPPSAPQPSTPPPAPAPEPQPIPVSPPPSAREAEKPPESRPGRAEPLAAGIPASEKAPTPRPPSPIVQVPSAPKPYSVSRVRSAIRSRETRNMASSAADKVLAPRPPDDWTLRLPFIFLVLAIIVLGVLPMVRIPGASVSTGGKRPAEAGPGQHPLDSEPDKIRDRGIPDTFRMGRMCRLTATVEKSPGQGIIFLKSDDKVFRVEYAASLPMLIGGDPVTVEMVPYHTLKSGVIVAEGHMIVPRSP